MPQEARRASGVAPRRQKRPTSASAANETTVPTRNTLDSVPRTWAPGARWYSSAIGGPPIAAIVPIMPESAPPASRDTGRGSTCTPETLKATASSTMPPNNKPSCSAGSTASTSVAGIVPASRPTIAHRAPLKSMARCSRTASIIVNSMLDARIGPGTSRVSTRTSIGEPRIPIPNPTAPWRVKPTTLHSTTMAMSKGDMVIAYSPSRRASRPKPWPPC